MPSIRHPNLLLSRHFTDFDELAQRILGFGLDWIQLDRGPMSANLQQVGLPSTIVTRFQVNRKYHQRGSSTPGMRTFAVLSPDAPPVGWGRDSSSGNRLVVFPTVDDFQFVSKPGFAGDTITISDQTLRNVAELKKMKYSATCPQAQAFVEVDSRKLGRLRSLLTSIHAPCTESSPESAREFEFFIASALLEMIGHDDRRKSSRPSPRSRGQALLKALDFIEQHAFTAPLIEDVHRASQASWRTLDYAFRERFEMTPKEYLNARRLVGVRRDLLQGTSGATVGEIAAKWGFRHAGWFAADYRKHFGELPSATRERMMRA